MGYLRTAILAVSVSPLTALAQASSTQSSTAAASTTDFTSATTSIPSTFATSTSSQSCSLITTFDGFMLVTNQQCGTSNTALWTSSLTYLAEVPSTILQTPGTNTVTPWDVVQATPEVYSYSDVLNPWGFPTPSPWPSSLLNPHYVGKGAKKDISYSVPIGTIVGITIAVAALLSLVGALGFFMWQRQRSVHLGKGSIGMGLGKTLGKGLHKSDMVVGENEMRGGGA